MPSEQYSGANYGVAAAEPVYTLILDEQKILISASECNLYGFDILNLDAAVRYVKLYDAATIASVTLGTTVPVMIIPVPASGGRDAFPNIPLHHFTTGIVAAMTTTAALAGVTGPTTDAYAMFYIKD